MELVIRPITAPAVRDASGSQKDDSHRTVFTPIIIDYAKKTNVNLSLKEKLACDTYVKTQSWSACAKAIRDQYGIPTKPETVKRWVERNLHVQGYLARKLLDVGYFNNWTRERWIRAVEAHAQGMEIMEFEDGQVFKFDKGAHFRLKLLGDALGYTQEQAKAGLQNNIQINFTQADGRE